MFVVLVKKIVIITFLYIQDIQVSILPHAAFNIHTILYGIENVANNNDVALAVQQYIIDTKHFD